MSIFFYYLTEKRVNCIKLLNFKGQFAANHILIIIIYKLLQTSPNLPPPRLPTLNAKAISRNSSINNVGGLGRRIKFK